MKTESAINYIKYNAEELQYVKEDFEEIINFCSSMIKQPSVKEKVVEKVDEVKKPVKKSVLSRIVSITEDLLDDGKLNYSNDPSKKSPGRKKKRK